VLIANAAVLVAQTPQPDRAARVTDRIQALQREAQQLAAQSRTLLGDLRRLAVERDLRTEEAHQADAAARAAEQELEATSARVTTLEQQRQAQLPDLRKQLVDIYKRGRTGYAALLFGATNIRDLARATRAIASLSTINERRLEAHRATLAALRAERAAQQEKAAQLRAQRQRAAQTTAAAERAVAARAALISQIDAQRDLNAQYVGELQQAYLRLQQQIGSSGNAPVEVPLAPFRGALTWPTAGPVVTRFGQADRPGEGAVRNGIEIAAAEGAPVRAVHGGIVAFSGPFTGFGTLIILDHGGNDFTLYGSLGSVTVERGAVVDAGTEIGTTGTGANGTAALYFEVRIDGRSVDPLQWLKPR
jgi:septal ring factor EnvC (AmiA/AmiB activator)